MVSWATALIASLWILLPMWDGCKADHVRSVHV
jgi:hypothetical protein